MTKEDLEQFLVEVFPQVHADFGVEEVQDMFVRIRLKVGERHLRPGPAMFSLADVSAYLAIMAMIGPKALAVTTNCSIDFMRKPVNHADLIAECRLLKLGKVLAVSDALLFSEGMEQPVARATLTYSIPPER